MEEKIKYQYIMDSRAYRRKMIATRAVIATLLAGAGVAFVLMELVLGILVPIVILFLGALWIIFGLQNEMTYTVYNTRFVIKNRDKFISVPLENVKSVKYRSAFYERDILTGTMILRAADPKSGKVKTYKMKHIFDGRAGTEYIASQIGKTAEEQNADTKK